MSAVWGDAEAAGVAGAASACTACLLGGAVAGTTDNDIERSRPLSAAPPRADRAAPPSLSRRPSHTRGSTREALGGRSAPV
mmetsp:Transcript_1939/g.6198  ORF Transcript_1939/g.6198 Transcript_1939/m.6198 type:complete len:81 (-) Transcript_1939:209-451(-)